MKRIKNGHLHLIPPGGLRLARRELRSGTRRIDRIAHVDWNLSCARNFGYQPASPTVELK